MVYKMFGKKVDGSVVSSLFLGHISQYTPVCVAKF